MNDIVKIEVLGGILSRHIDKLIDKASERSQRLADVISSAGEAADKQGIIRELAFLKRTMDTLSVQVRTNAIPTILLNYADCLLHPTPIVLPSKSQVAWFFLRQKERGDKFAKDIASFLSRECGTLEPMTVMEMDMQEAKNASFDFGAKQVELSEAVDALDRAFMSGSINMGAVDDLQDCLRISNCVSKDIFTTSNYQRFSELSNEFDVGGALWSLPHGDDNALLSPLECANEVAARFETFTGDVSEALKPFMQGLPKREPVQYVYTEPSNGEYFPRLKKEYQREDIAKGIADVIIKHGLIPANERDLFLYRFFAYGPAPQPDAKVHWADHVKKNNEIGNPTELLFILNALYNGAKSIPLDDIEKIIAISTETRDKMERGANNFLQLARRAPRPFCKDIEDSLS